MPPSAEKLAAIDAELDAFGKTEQQLADIVQRAVEVSASVADDDALAELVAGAHEAVASARAAVKAARPPSRRPRSQASTAVGTPAPAAQDGAVEPEEDEPMGSGLVEIPEEELRRHDLPPVLNLGDADAFPSHPPPPSGGLDDAFETAAVSDIHGLSVDELFEDTSATAPPSSGSHDLGELFADEEPIRLSDPEIEVESIEKPPPRPRTVPPPVPPGAMSVKSPPRLQPGAFPDEETDATMVGSLADLMAAEDSFELLVDEDVLELDDLSATEPPPEEEPEAGAEPKGGLISRILGRK